MNTVKCPICRSEIEIPEEFETGDYLECDGCGADMELTELRPPKVSLYED